MRLAGVPLTEKEQGIYQKQYPAYNKSRNKKHNTFKGKVQQSVKGTLAKLNPTTPLKEEIANLKKDIDDLEYNADRYRKRIWDLEKKVNELKMKFVFDDGEKKRKEIEEGVRKREELIGVTMNSLKKKEPLSAVEKSLMPTGWESEFI